MSLNKNHQAAARYAKAGISVIPTHPANSGKKSKRPALRSWKEYQERIPSEQELQEFFPNGSSVAVVCGQVSGGLEIIDFDDPETTEPFFHELQAADSDLAKRLVYQSTPSGGLHLIYRCPEVEGNQKLAMDETGQEVRIETRGQGGYFLVFPSPGYLMEGDLTKVPVITIEQRQLLLQLARSFDLSEEPEKPPQEPQAPPRNDFDRNEGETTKPGDLFNQRESWSALLEAEGWVYLGEKGDRSEWQRPGQKEKGKAGATLHPELGLYVFSSSTNLPQEKPISKFAFYAFTQHAGDFKAAAKAISREYGLETKSRKPDSDHGDPGPQEPPGPDKNSDLSVFCQPHSTPVQPGLKDLSASGLIKQTASTTDLSVEVDEFVAGSQAAFTNNDVYSELCIRDPVRRRRARNRLVYLEKRNIISKIQGQNGAWERIQTEEDSMDFAEAVDEAINMWFPLGIFEHAVIRPGSVVMVAGEPNAGKTTFMLQTILRNLPAEADKKGATHYLSESPTYSFINKTTIGGVSKGEKIINYINSEMSTHELKARIASMGSDVHDWLPHVNFYKRSFSFHQRVEPNCLNIIDYLEVVKDFFDAGNLIQQIHSRLDKGIAIIGIQKHPNQSVGYGGQLTLQKPRLYLNLKKNENLGFICEAAKVKEPVDFMNKIEGMELDFHISNDGQLVPDKAGWRYVSESARKAINIEKQNRRY